jgi:hypothetical protein
MKFAKYWKDVIVKVPGNIFGRDTITVWGASDTSLEDANADARKRASTFEMMVAKGIAALRDYEYCSGFVREEVLSEVKAEDGRVIAVLTRNNYGAVILNTESVFFGDIDIQEGGLFARILQLFGTPKKDKDYHLKRIEAFQKKNPGYTISVYETFAGLRLVVTNVLFDNGANADVSLFNELDVDPLYRKLCKVQSCYRARLTPKPWRIGLERPGSRFPRKPGNEETEFEKWLREYESAIRRYAVVKHLHTFGSQAEHPDAKEILMVHDKYSLSGSKDLA